MLFKFIVDVDNQSSFKFTLGYRFASCGYEIMDEKQPDRKQTDVNKSDNLLEAILNHYQILFYS